MRMNDRSVPNHGDDCLDRDEGSPRVDAKTFARILNGSYGCPSLDELASLFAKNRQAAVDGATRAAIDHAQSCPSCAAIWRIIEATEHGAREAAQSLLDEETESQVG
jgi:hypothetical protein